MIYHGKVFKSMIHQIYVMFAILKSNMIYHEDILPRRDFGPLSTYHSNLLTYHNKNPNHIEEQGPMDSVSLQGNLPCGQHGGKILHQNRSAQEGCLRKVLPSPDGQRLWLVLGTPLTAVH